MGENSKIEWCDHTWNPWLGCTKVGPPCDFCYAEDMMDHRYGRVRWGAGEDRVRTSPANWLLPFRWDKAAKQAGKLATVFSLSLGDIWDNEVDSRWRNEALDVMERTPNLIYLLLSKRIGNADKMCDPAAGNHVLPRNAALGATMASQDEWDRDLPKLKDAAQALGPLFIFASVEPMLGRIDAGGELPDWVIVGGESGPHARPMHPDWVRSIQRQCEAAGVAFFFKQWGEYAPSSMSEWVDDDGSHRHLLIAPDGRCGDTVADAVTQPKGTVWLRRVGKKAAGRLLDGVEHNGFPVIASAPARAA